LKATRAVRHSRPKGTVETGGDYKKEKPAAIALEGFKSRSKPQSGDAAKRSANHQGELKGTVIRSSGKGLDGSKKF